MAAMPPSGSMTSPWPLSRKVWFSSLTSNRASRCRRYLSVRQSLASSTAARLILPWYCSSLASKRLKRENASAVEPAKPARILSLYKRRILRAVCLTTPSPNVTCPSPAMTTCPSRRTHKTVVERTSLGLLMGAILHYSSGLWTEARAGSRGSGGVCFSGGKENAMRIPSFFLAVLILGASLAAQTAPPQSKGTPPPSHQHMMAMQQHMQEMKAQLAKMQSNLEQMKANAAKIKDPAAQQQANLDAEMWQMMVTHMQGMQKM